MAIFDNQLGKLKKLISESTENLISFLSEFSDLENQNRQTTRLKLDKKKTTQGPPKYAQISYPPRKPERILSLIVTEKCNSRCSYCLRKAGKEQKEISFSILKNLILSAHRFGINHFSLTGGEFFIYPHWRETIKLIGILGGEVYIETNGAFLEEKSVGFLKKTLNNKITEILISLDSHKADIHDKFRGPGSFNKAVQAIKLLRKHDIFIQTNVLLTPLNFMKEKDILNLIEFNKYLGVKRIFFSDAVEIGRARKSKFVLTENQRKQIGLIFGKYNYFKEENQIEVSAKVFKEDYGVQSCERIGREICVSPSGIYPCTFLAGLVKIGDIKDFEKILYSDFLTSFYWTSLAAQRYFKRHSFFSRSQCTKCLPEWLSIVQKQVRLGE
jgi:MoaA/NifB/PqqE/SkfB family radical SAM enzyme